jgi:hypothetical protein
MRFKIAGDGTFTGTNLYNEYDEEISGYSSLKFKLYPTTGNLAIACFDIEANEMDFDIKPRHRHNPIPVTKVINSGRSNVILKLAGDGTALGSILLDSEADTPIDGITKIVWKNGVVKVWIIDALIELKSTCSPIGLKSASPSPSYQGQVGQVTGPYSYSPQPPQPPDDPGQLHLDFDDIQDDRSISCQHQWINASFTGLKMVCKHCNAEKA